MAGNEHAKITVQDPGERQQAVRRPGIEMLPPMPRMPGLLWAEAEQARGMQISVTPMHIGIGVMLDVVLVTPPDVPTADEISRECHEPVEALVARVAVVRTI